MTNNLIPVPSVKFESKITEVTKHLIAAFNNLKRIDDEYTLDIENFVFDQNSFDEFVRKVCEHHFGRIYSKRGVSKVFAQKIRGDIRDAVITALEKRTTSERLQILVAELKKLP